MLVLSLRIAILGITFVRSTVASRPPLTTAFTIEAHHRDKVAA